MKQLNLWLLLFVSLSYSCGNVSVDKKNTEQTIPPNIIYILADDLGYGDISSYNPDAAIRTKHIDGLAEKGMRFIAAHTSSSVCTPTRYSLLTGRYNWRSYLKESVLYGYDLPLIDTGRMTTAQLLKEQGYQTACIGKWHLGLKLPTTDGEAPYFQVEQQETNIDWSGEITQGPVDLGFDYFYGISASLDMPPYLYIHNNRFVGTYDTIKAFHRPGPAAADFEAVNVLPEITQKAVSYISEQSAEQPFFLYFALTAPHTPIAPDSVFQGQSDLHEYLDFCLQVDHTVGQITQAVRKAGLEENTMIIFTSDNGFAPYVDKEHVMEQNGHMPSYVYRGYKADIWEGGHRVPFIVQWPGVVQPQQISDEVISLTDLIATCADITRAPLPDNAGEDSYSFLSVLQGENLKKPLREGTVYHSFKGEFAIQQGKWKLILCPGSGGWSQPVEGKGTEGLFPFQLYDLKNDPEEQNNLYEKNPEMVQQLKTLMTRYIREGRSTPGAPQQNDPVDQWPQVDWMR